ncbi:hypothetical protein IFT48_04750 [Pseudomonas fluorescens]|uniref:hypothetical protein n=1 Tax=Pseudomonas TaxID=286 RepID=UPI000F013D0A|nr:MULTISPECIES: hypothetical protein [Pseudomonas]MBD8089283.1 hypothetical protein [Pseudomonas fluorescens]MBD8682056.1 hypothetical protein [Pseudomonas sp. CFBP 13719]
MRKRKNNLLEALPNREPLIEELARLEALFDDMQTNLPKGPKNARVAAADVSTRLLKARRELLKVDTKRQELVANYEGLLGLDFVAEEDVDAINQVVQMRKQATDDYYRAYCLQNSLSRITREFAPILKGQLLEKIGTLEKQATDCRKGLFQIYWALPDVGMTLAEWEGLTQVQRRGLRPTGRPSLPLECQIAECEDQSQALLAEISKLSKGKVNTLEKALEGIELSTRGRPVISDIGKMERSAGRLRRDMERLDPKDFPSEAEHKKNPRLGDTYKIRIARLTARIEEIEDSIRMAESELEGVAVYRRELEKQRARHRDLVVLESKSNGDDQAKLLLEILRNEVEQQETVEMIRQADPQATETLTHRVNPKETRERLSRLEMNGRLADSEMLILKEIKESIMGKHSTRGR